MTEWAYSPDGERFHGPFDTEEEAHTAADYMSSYYIGQVQYGDELANPYFVGMNAVEYLDESLAEDIGWDDLLVELTKEETEQLGKLIIDFVQSKQGFRAWGVTKVTKHTHLLLW